MLALLSKHCKVASFVHWRIINNKGNYYDLGFVAWIIYLYQPNYKIFCILLSKKFLMKVH